VILQLHLALLPFLICPRFFKLPALSSSCNVLALVAVSEAVVTLSESLWFIGFV
jgi:hypothetical protein